ncbi:hypothetical protein ACFSGX_16170 [Sphingomonas arantia]|uniref:CopG family transcriptional regulator n=1 Tax=Sphingomonas arantia TaxID=1460676 RepID=A0ABW4U1X9_9SPHN
MRQIGIEVDEATLAEIDRYATAHDMDRGTVLRLAVSDLIAEYAAIDRYVQVGLDSLENEPTLSQAEVRDRLADRRRHRIAAE